MVTIKREQEIGVFGSKSAIKITQDLDCMYIHIRHFGESLTNPLWPIISKTNLSCQLRAGYRSVPSVGNDALLNVKWRTLAVTQTMMTTMTKSMMKRTPRPSSATYSGGNARKSSKYVRSARIHGRPHVCTRRDCLSK